MSSPFDKPPMTQQQFEAAPAHRGFTWNQSRQLWVGPFGLTVTGISSQANFITASGTNNAQGIGNSGITGGGIGPGVSGLRKTLLAQVDEQLRAKRGLPRPLHRPSYDPPNSPPPVH